PGRTLLRRRAHAGAVPRVLLAPDGGDDGQLRPLDPRRLARASSAGDGALAGAPGLLRGATARRGARGGAGRVRRAPRGGARRPDQCPRVNPGTAGLARGLAALSALADDSAARDGLGVVRLAEVVGGDKSQLSRTLQALEEHGFVERDPQTLAFRLGWRLFALAARVGESRLLAEAPPVLRALVRELGESVHLSVRQGDQVLTLLSESPPATLHAP